LTCGYLFSSLIFICIFCFVCVCFFFFFFWSHCDLRDLHFSLHDALPICWSPGSIGDSVRTDFVGPTIHDAAKLIGAEAVPGSPRSEEHTSELQSLRHLVCRLLLEKKNKPQYKPKTPRPQANDIIA